MVDLARRFIENVETWADADSRVFCTPQVATRSFENGKAEDRPVRGSRAARQYVHMGRGGVYYRARLGGRPGKPIGHLRDHRRSQTVDDNIAVPAGAALSSTVPRTHIRPGGPDPHGDKASRRRRHVHRDRPRTHRPGPRHRCIVAIGLIKFTADGTIIDEFATLVTTPDARAGHGTEDDDLIGAPTTKRSRSTRRSPGTDELGPAGPPRRS